MSRLNPATCQVGLYRRPKPCGGDARKYLANCCVVPSFVNVVIPQLSQCNSCGLPIPGQPWTWATFNAVGVGAKVPVSLTQANFYEGWHLVNQAVGTAALYIDPPFCTQLFKFAEFDRVGIYVAGALAALPVPYFKVGFGPIEKGQLAIKNPSVLSTQLVSCLTVPLGQAVELTMSPCSPAAGIYNSGINSATGKVVVLLE